MKRIAVFVLLSFLLLSFCACGLLDFGKISVGERVEDDENTKEGISDSAMRYISHTETSLTVEMANGSQSTWQSGNMRDYELHVKKDGVWHRVEQKGEFANTMELMLFAPGDTITHTFEFDERYGRLTPGEYRVVKNFWANETDSQEAGAFYLSCEFIVE